MRAVRSVRITATPERVWQLMTDVERWPTWTASTTSVELLDGGELAVGSPVRIRQPRLPVTTWRVTELVPGRSFTWVAKGIGFTTTAEHALTSDGDDVLVTLTLDQTGPLGSVVGAVYRGLTEQYLLLEAEGLKAASEANRK